MKKDYIPPRLDIVTIPVESGFSASLDAEHLNFSMSLFDNDEDYNQASSYVNEETWSWGF